MSNHINNKTHIALFATPIWMPIALLGTLRVIWFLAGADWDGGHQADVSSFFGMALGGIVVMVTASKYGIPDFSFLDKRKDSK